MKFWLIAALSVAFGSFILASPLGAKECTWGPTHWCQNLTNAKNCKAVKHCIQTVWEKQTLPEDNDSVCQICLDMVKQARDQLESNETQDDLRAVFEGSCKLMYIKPIVKECITVVDNFIPELIEALASQMNPQVVCSVAGLCNNAHIDKLLEEHKGKLPDLSNEGKEFTCGKCSSISSTITTKFHSTSRDTILENMLEMCGRMSSFSDACSNIFVTYFGDIYQRLSDTLTPDALCHVAGACAGKFHQHPEDVIEVRPMSDVGFVEVQDDPDIPCALCEQLVNHLRDLLTANTTEMEFKSVLEGLCGQTKGFKDECISLVDQYYAEIYEFITKNLDPNEACFYIGVCPKGLHGENPKKSPIAPLVPLNVQPPRKLLGQNEPKFTEEEINAFQLPIERLSARPIDKIMGAPNSAKLERGGNWCTLCEYAMHFVQEELANERNEEQLKNIIIGTCHKMPQYLRAECDNFVELYGDAILALLIQEIDPATICPQAKLCPSLEVDSEVFAPSTIHVQINSESREGKGSCPLCLLAVQQAKEVIQDEKTEEKVKETLKTLCSHLKNKKLNLECQDFVDTYSKELLELLVRDFTPQEICAYLKLCTDQPKALDIVIKNDKNMAIETNEIGDNTIDGIMFTTSNDQPVAETPECLLCKDIIKEVENRVQNRTSKAEIKHALDHACEKIPRKARNSCHNYVNKYGDRIAELIQQEMAPKEICRDLGLCVLATVPTELAVDEAIKVTVFTSPAAESKAPLNVKGQTCILCEMIVARMDKDLEKPATQAQVKRYLDEVCVLIPKSYRKECDNFIATYAQALIETVDHIPPKALCTQIQACAPHMQQKEKEDVLECAVCNGAVSALDTIIKDKSYGDDFDIFDEACHALSGRYYERCQNLLKTYGISMIEQLKQKLESDQICVNIGMCYSTEASGFVEMSEDDSSEAEDDSDEDSEEVPIVKSKAFIVGESECTWGPTHWCKDEETATKCGSVDFCKTKSLGKWSA